MGEKGIVSSTDLAALVEQTRGSSSWSAELPTRGVLAFVEQGEPISELDIPAVRSVTAW
jgi:hypothetical protein